ncbi:EAL domain-containing protein [Janthinobacterium fluminis]|uniref:EAL domain-containing protein n=1 Tax=Janthinobacterium fluminis TaxID=2987524 RepID=A0ABT5K898_9BURK|nr:EAL domain-containing protein [Janthinobacterium fluminis]MDC8760663.1 EAL domain-containing protein [Janthinobacterium fluminis]
MGCVHTVQFYENDSFLIKGLADYIGAALRAGDKGVVIATRRHLDELEEALKGRGLLDNAGAEANGRYIPLEVDHMLPLFMENGLPNEERFSNEIGDVIARAAFGHSGHVYIFGEMVAILCGLARCPLRSLGKHDAAIYVERYFNKLLQQHSFSLLCGYPLSAFPRQQDHAMFQEVCALHTAVLPAESYDIRAGVDTLQRTVADLQQQAFALAAEVHDRAQIEQALREVNFDRLTGLPNRSVFQSHLEMDIKRAHRSQLPLALLFIDLDHFKEINDTLGHQTGDLLLLQVGRRLASYVRETDTVARLGGDEFTITLSELQDVDSATHIAQKILDDLARPFHLGAEVAYISASIGITLYPQDAGNASELLRNADQAMYQSKDAGRNRFSYFTRSMQEVAQARMNLSNDLRRAIGGPQLQVYYQPIVDLATGRIGKAEALLRWRHPAQGLISPVEFIPIAEHNGLIVTIGDWVFHEALRQAGHWRALDADFTVSVNVSPAQFYRNNDEHYSEWLRHCKGGSPAVGLEITEGLLLASNAAVIQQLLAFQDAGIQLSLDDFGTGYSSLSYLRKFNLDFLKIDQSFVYNLEHDAANVALCEAIIVMAHKLGLKVIAEGIETWPQCELLSRAGCDYGQGFLFGPALPVEEFEALLKAPAGGKRLGWDAPPLAAPLRD